MPWALGTAAAQPAPPAAMHFVALGDMPYGLDGRAGPAFRHLIDLVNAERPPFSIHVGDFKDGLTECTDALFDRVHAYFQRFDAALVLTPGDNDWTDCQRHGADPLERLQALRQRFYATAQSMGRRPIALQRQPDTMPAYAPYRENQRWRHGSVLFATCHVIGPRDNTEAASGALRMEQRRREAANAQWVRDAFVRAAAEGATALVLAMQADVFRPQRHRDEPREVRKAFRPLISDTLLPLVQAARLPVLLVHGDSHHLIADRPFRDRQGTPIDRLWRLQVPGDGRMHAVRVTVDGRAAEPFSFQQIWNPMAPDPR